MSVPGSLGIPMKTSTVASTTDAPIHTAPRTDAAVPPRAVGRRRTETGCVVTAERGRLDRNSHPPLRTAHGITNNTNEDERESAPASAIRITLETIENARSRRRGTSNAWSTCTQRNNDAKGTRAWSTEPASWTLCRNAANAASSPTDSNTLVVRFEW